MSLESDVGEPGRRRQLAGDIVDPGDPRARLCGFAGLANEA